VRETPAKEERETIHTPTLSEAACAPFPQSLSEGILQFVSSALHWQRENISFTEE